MITDITKLADSELVEIMASTVIGTPSGLKAQQAQAELLRRNTEALISNGKSSDHSADNMMGLSLIVGQIAFLQLMFQIFGSPEDRASKVIIAAMVFCLVAYTFRDYFVTGKNK